MTRVRVSQPSDAREREARWMASRVLAAPGAPAHQLAPAKNPNALPDDARRFFEPRFGHSFADVRIHHDPAAATALGARAYTAGEDIVFGADRWAPGTPEGQELLAHELAHVVQDRASPTDVVHRDRIPTSSMTVNGDRVRSSPAGGVPVRNGTLRWTLEFIGIHGTLTIGTPTVTPGTGSPPPSVAPPPTPAPSAPSTPPGDVRLRATYTPNAGAVTCPTVTWVQTVRTSTDGVPDIGRLLITRDPSSGASVDAGVDVSEPFYGADPAAATTASQGWQESAPGWQGSTGQTPGGPGTAATHGDLPRQLDVHRGTTITRMFEAAAICVDTAETFCSIDWGYTKTSAGVITLLGGRQSDVHTTGATAAFENVRQAFYRGQFQHSLNGFARGSSALLPAHTTLLDSIPATANRIILVGANDNSGGPEANAQLSLERARAAATYLVNQRQFTPSTITVEGHGVEARVPNAPGADVPANRRVDVHFQQGAAVAPPMGPRTGIRARQRQLMQQNPLLLVDETVDWILELFHRSTTPTATDLLELDDMLTSLRRWRRSDPTVPELQTIYARQIQQIRDRVFGIQRGRPEFPRPEPQPPSFIPRILEDSQRVRP